MFAFCRFAFFAWFVLAESGEVPALQPAKIFSDHMVLQRDAKVPVWGTTNPAAEVVVEFDGQIVSTTADSVGRWRLVLSPMKVNGDGQYLTIRSDGQTVTLRDVLVGEVWFAGGQSNMDQKMGSSARRLAAAQTLVASADYPATALAW